MPPLKFIPLLKRIRWGGRRLGEILGKPIGPFSDYAESWEVCDHGGDQSIVANGPCAGWSLARLVRECAGELLGRHAGVSQFPLLLKFLDAHDRLSVQVHPDDKRARRFIPNERGKTEAWVILAAETGSCVFAGLRQEIDEPALREAIARGTVEQCLNRVSVSPGDCLFIPAGTVHALGEGILLAEVQQSSDMTFRLFDWNRLDADGKPRTLHVEQSLACTNFAQGPVDKVAPHPLPGCDHSVEELASCPYFTILRHSVPDRTTIGDDQRCHVLMGLAGQARVVSQAGEQSLAIGETVLVPATALPVVLHADKPTVLLEVFWP